MDPLYTVSAMLGLYDACGRGWFLWKSMFFDKEVYFLLILVMLISDAEPIREVLSLADNRCRASVNRASCFANGIVGAGSFETAPLPTMSTMVPSG